MADAVAEEIREAPLLRVATAGSVDDGKSTLIGRLLLDTKQVFEDQLDAVRDASRRRSGNGALDLSLLTDGLRAEREQGITIDVAYRYFATPRRRFIMADTPGHKQYTRNMATGASTAEVQVVLLDARKGVLEQSRRHAYIATLLGIPQLAVCVNKMDLVDYSEERYLAIVEEFSAYLAELGSPAAASFIPVSALHGENVVQRSERMPWYEGPTLLEQLEDTEVEHAHPESEPLRLPVQWVIRPPDGDYRGYAGRLAAGVLRRGEELVALPSGQRTRVAGIDVFEGELEEACAPLSVVVRLSEEIDISRGEMLCRPGEEPAVSREISAAVVWMAERPLRRGDRVLVKHTTRTVPAIVEEIVDLLDVETLERHEGPSSLELNDIGHVRLRLASPLAFDTYADARATGAFILIDEAVNATLAAGMIQRS